MDYIGFRTLAEALTFRALHGGWIFEPTTGLGCIWFHPSYTPTPIMLHPATRGLSGKLL